MEYFPAKYFTFATKYPESGSRMQFARSYTYTVEADAPDQRVFILTLPGMQYFTDGNGVIDPFTTAERNMAILEQFYSRHRLAKSFYFDHPVYGVLTCKFNRPLEIPEGVVDGNGVLEPFTLELIEVL